MQLAMSSVPKTNAQEGKRYGGEGGLVFCSVKEGFRDFAARHAAAKLLCVYDSSACGAFSRLQKAPRVLSIVLDSEDALPLFSMPDGVSCLVAAGEKRTLQAARFFAKTQGIPCALFPASLTLDGAYEESGTVRVNGERIFTSLCDGEVFCDLSLCEKSAPQAYARLLLTRLALIEGRALRAFSLSAGNREEEERLYSLLYSPQEELREVALLHEKIRLAERAGAYAGEGICLARQLAQDGARMSEKRAYMQLRALYSAFFIKGVPRRFYVPDYRVRAKSAGGAYAAQSIPAVSEYARRALVLERVRAEYAGELVRLKRDEGSFFRMMRKYGGGDCAIGDTSLLCALPEHTGGLTAIIRDFGLLERI